MVALLPLVPGVSILTTQLADRALPGSTAFDESYVFYVSSAVLGTLATILLWRKLVVWSFGRAALTATVALIPLAQVLYPYPLWSNPGCAEDDILRMGQHSLDAGLWVWLTIWAWWGWEKGTMKANDKSPTLRTRIGAPHRLIIASVGYVPLMVGLFFMLSIAWERFLNLNIGSEVGTAYALSAVPAVVIWVILWSRGRGNCPFPWRPALEKAGICIGLPIAALFANAGQPPPYEELQVLPLIGWGVWMIWTAWTWPLLPNEYADTPNSPRCRSCGYSLIGLRWTRCPECGDEPTLDELWQASTSADV
jgi:hypothetical protein